MRVVQWAQHPGPVGGVTRSVEDLTEGLRAVGHDVRYVDTGSPVRAVRALPGVWRRRCLHLFHITRVWRAIVLSPLFWLLPGRTVLVLHSGAVRRQVEAQHPGRARLLRLSLRAYDEIWAVSTDIGSALPDHLRDRVHVVSPFVPSPVPAASRPPRERHLLTVATNSGLPYYNAELAVDVVRLLRRDWPDARLWILAYDRDGPELSRLRESVADLDWVQLSLNLSGMDVAAALARSEVFLRPTDWDGDSVIVREALAVGTRVVASDVSARPAGVELSGLTAQELAAAVVSPGRVSDGTGLADLTVIDAVRAAMAGLFD
jgi:glycosyltransferase involved in cell wall biosynthesis